MNAEKVFKAEGLNAAVTELIITAQEMGLDEATIAHSLIWQAVYNLMRHKPEKKKAIEEIVFSSMKMGMILHKHVNELKQ